MALCWTLTYAYIASALAVVLGIVTWGGQLLQQRLYGGIGDGAIDEGWLATAHWLAAELRYFTFAGAACALLALLLAVFASGEPAAVVQAHKSYVLRLAVVVLGFLFVAYLGSGSLDRVSFGAAMTVAALPFGLWSGWLVAAGWRALMAAEPVAGPQWWLLSLVALLLVVARFIALVFFVSSDSPYQF